MRVEGWIFKDNTIALLDELERLTGASLDLGERIALLDAIAATDGDADPERWTCQAFEGADRMDAEFALDQGTQVLRVRLNASDEVAREAKILMAMMQSYFLHPRNPPRRD